MERYNVTYAELKKKEIDPWVSISLLTKGATLLVLTNRAPCSTAFTNIVYRHGIWTGEFEGMGGVVTACCCFFSLDPKDRLQGSSLVVVEFRLLFFFGCIEGRDEATPV
jgi:hypothetical protein